MGLRRFGGLLALVMLALVLVACGGESSDDEPTAAPTTTPPATTAETPTATIESPSTPDVATPMASPVASPIVSSQLPVVTASADSTPVASPAASPAATSPLASPVGDVATPRASWLLEGTVMLPGSENEHFVLGGDGCLGLGDYAGVGTGQQVVVEDAQGTIIGLATLADGDSSSQCIWTFAVEVPVSDFYTVSLPLLFERVYSDADLSVIDGRLQITLP